MKITYYGTAAAEGMPALFCYCDHCERARKAGGKNIRTRSQALVNDDLLIDFPPDTYLHVLSYGLNLRDITNILITHAHSDHLYSCDLEFVRPPYAHRKPDAEPITVYSSRKSAKPIIDAMYECNNFAKGALNQRVFSDFETLRIGKYDVTALPANHAKHLDPYIYAISDGEKSLLYGHDSGWFLPETWEYLEKNKPYFNFISLDCTCTCDEIPYPNGHMNLLACSNAKKKLLEIGCADENTIFCLHHFSHNGSYTYDELVPVAAEIGFIVSHDNMTVEF